MTTDILPKKQDTIGHEQTTKEIQIIEDQTQEERKKEEKENVLASKKTKLHGNTHKNK